MLVYYRYNKVVQETGSKFTPQNSTIVQFETALTQSQGQPMKVDCLDTGSLLGFSLPRFCNQFNFQDNSFFLIHRYWKSFSALIDYSIFETKHAVHDHEPGIPGGGGPPR